MAFVEMAHNYKLIILSIMIVLSVACLNSFGVAVTKYSSATQRTVVDSIRNILVWVFFLTYTGPGHEEFVLIQFFGFVVMFFGSLIYNEILVIPFFGMNKYTKGEI